MAYYQVTEDVEAFVLDIANGLFGSDEVKIKVLFDDKLKTFASVKKGNKLVEYLTETSPVIIVYVNEALWEAFGAIERRMLLENELLGVAIDHEKGSVKISAPDMQINSECWRAYGDKLLNAYLACLFGTDDADDDGYGSIGGDGE